MPEHVGTLSSLAPKNRSSGRRAWCLASLGMAAWAWSVPGVVRAQRLAPGELQAQWGSARLHGQARLRFMGLHVYDIRLWTADAAFATADWAAQRLALEIEYARELVGRLIAERSLKEMRRAGPIDDAVSQRWLQAMTQLFPDVKSGDRITGVHTPVGVARFFHNGALRGELREPEFARRFFGIWLAEHTSEPSLRERLLGGS